MKNPYEVIKIDKNTKKIQSPDLLLMNRSFDIIGKIPQYTNWNISLVGNGLDEITFEVHKYSDGILCPIWDDLVDLKIVDVRTFGRFEISVDYTDNTETVKSVHGVSLETELGQIPLFEFHVNDDEAADMEITKYSEINYKDGEYIPTTFYKKNDPNHSLLHRVLADKAPHWSIGHVPDFIILEDKEPEPVETFQRTYTCDGDTIYDFLTGTVAEESNVVFIFDTIHREINCYNLCEYKATTDYVITNSIVLNSLHHSDYIKCGDSLEITKLSLPDTSSIICYTYDENKNLKNTISGIKSITTIDTNKISYVRFFYAYAGDTFTNLSYKVIFKQGVTLGNCIGEDTTILVSKRKLANEITISSNKDNVKNCFRIEGGDDVITDTVRAVNLNGSNYIYQFADFQLKDMPDELQQKIKKYNEMIGSRRDEYYGEDGIYTQLCEAYDELLHLESGMMPDVSPKETNAETEYWNAVSQLKEMTIGVSSVNNYNNDLFVGITNNVEAMAQILVDARYKVEVIDDTTNYDSSNKKWTGNIKVTRVADETDYFPKTTTQVNNYFNVLVSDDQLEFAKQKIQKALVKGSMSDIDFDVEGIWGDTTLNEKEKEQKIREYFELYSLNRLKSFSSGYNSCISILAQMNLTTKGIGSDSPVHVELFDKYSKYLSIVDNSNPRTNTDVHLSVNRLARSEYIECGDTSEIIMQNLNHGYINCELYDENKTLIKTIEEINRSTVINTVSATYIKFFYASDEGRDISFTYKTSSELGVLQHRQSQVDEVNSTIDSIKDEQKKFQEDMNFQKFLGDDLYKIFCSYRREDTYQNDNYVSDGFSTSECLSKAKELVEAANVEIKKSCVLQRTVSTTLNNLFALPEFEPLYDKFALFNYIRIRTEDEILKLRLIGVDFSGESVENIQVTFSEQIESIDGKMSDLENVLQQASSIATSYSSTALQAKQGAEARNIFSEIYSQGLNAAETILTNNDSNEITITSSGILCRRMDDEGYYGEKQLRITGNIMAFTKDNWKSVEMAFGETEFKNPITGKSEYKYGLLAQAIVGKLILGENLGIYNSSASMQFDESGLMITNGTNTVTINPNDKSVLTVTNKDNTKLLSFDSDGNGCFKGKVEADSGYFKGRIEANEGFFHGNVEATKLEVYKYGQKYGQYDAGDWRVKATDSFKRKGIGIIAENFDKSYVGIGYKSKDDTPTLSYYMLVDNNEPTHHFTDKTYFYDEVDFYSYANIKNGWGLRLYPDNGAGSKWSTLKYRENLYGQESVYTDNHFICNRNIYCNGTAGNYQSGNINDNLIEGGHYEYQEFGGIVVAVITGKANFTTTAGTFKYFPAPASSINDTYISDNKNINFKGTLTSDGLTIKNFSGKENYFAFKFVYIKA